jgi:hypothetical protein
VPEIEHGPPRQRWIPGDGGDWRLEADRERNVFGGLTLDATLAPGQSFVVTCMPEMDGSLGHSFFTDDYGGTTQQKLVLIRLAQSQLDVLFDTEQILASPEDNK